MQDVENTPPPKFLDGSIQELIVEKWNLNTAVPRYVFYKDKGEVKKGYTRSRAFCHSSGKPQICIQGRWGSFDLEDVKLVNPQKKGYENGN